MSTVPSGGDGAALGMAVVCNDYATAWSPDLPPAQRESRYQQALAATAPGLEPSGCVIGIATRFIRTTAPGDLACLDRLPPIAVTAVPN
ncbi:hypothetical protein ABZ942_29690 [Nocardia sp. NPDC046473]|uniref:hypothetical protein n=1 Tax=Nocardia sp. NPDC046473 TaxID=3155733 RepID=UPI0033C4136C